MSSHFSAQCLPLLFLLVCTDLTHGKLHYITPSLDSPCPQNASSCLALSQFAASSNSSRNETNVSLLFLPGRHTLDRELHFAQGDNFSMTKDEQDNETVFVNCTGHSGRFDISETTSVSIMGINFIGCGSNRVSQVTWLTIADSNFKDVENKSTVLALNEVATANIIRSQFLFNTLEQWNRTRASPIYVYLFYEYKLLEYVYLQRNTSGGVLYTASSNVSIIGSSFMHNRADIGGALVAHNSSLHIDKSAYSYNTANFGGAMVTSGSTVIIYKSIFTHNSAQVSGGVMVTYKDRLSISSSAFTENTDTYYAGVMATFGNSLLTICNTNFTSNGANYIGGVMATFGDSVFAISYSSFTYNRATHAGVLLTYGNSSLTINSSNFTSNSANTGGVIRAFDESSFAIRNSSFSFNIASFRGGVIAASDHTSFAISYSTFTSNSAIFGGVILAYHESLFDISNGSFTYNVASSGGVMRTYDYCFFAISQSTFKSNSAIDYNGGVIESWEDSSFTINESTFSYNSAIIFGGVITAWDDSSFNICCSTFTSNNATSGGVMRALDRSSFSISKSTFASNSAQTVGGVIDVLSDSLFTINYSTFINNSFGGVIACLGETLNINNSNFSSNIGHFGEGILFIRQCSTHIANAIFDYNTGSIYAFNGNLTFGGHSKFGTSTEPLIAEDESTGQEGGVITSFQSTVIFARESITHFSNNQARRGSAILAIESTIIMYGEAMIVNNNVTAIANSSGGGISLKQSRLEIKGVCNIINNSAVRGGGIHATSSTIAVYEPGILHVVNNTAEFGGGMYLELNSKLYVAIMISTTEYFMIFTDNHAKYGGAAYVADHTNSGACSPNNECFIQTLALYQKIPLPPNTVHTLFLGNTASEQGSNLFGGLLDRCIPSPFAEVYLKQRIHYSGVTYLQNISIAGLDSITSQPVRVCFCNSEHEPDCSYQLPIITVKKGETFSVSAVAVDQVNNAQVTNITTSISSSDGGLGEGQQTQRVGSNCTDLTYTVFSPHDSETINLYADGPCESATLSTSHVTIQFMDCTCPVGFEPLSNSKSSTRCECVCNSKLSPYITDCDYATSSVFRVGTNSWITYINDTDQPGYITYPNCPFDYCHALTQNVTINFNLPNGTDAQCAYHRTGVLCGSCSGKFSLSLASSRCLSCHSHWPVVCVVILLAAIIAGILLVTALLALNMTVSIGLINGFIFYANIVSAGSAVFFPSSEPSFPSVFVAWLNLDIGIDACFINGLDAYIKTWLQLAFPMYIISLVVMVIIISEHFPRFAGLIGRKDPISTLATLILLSYAKLLSVTITSLSFAILDYPDGNREIVWLLDGNVKYFQGKHIPLALVALLIILIGLPYTILLFLWQWIVRAPRWKVFNWTRDAKLNAFIATYHVPYNSKYRYWTGMLLLVRVILYITSSVTVSANPQTYPLILAILIGGVIFFGKIFGLRVYKNSLVDVVDTVLYFNLLLLALFSQYEFKQNTIKQTAVAYTSAIITFILFIGSICYHVSLLIKKKKPREDVKDYPLVPVNCPYTQMTHSVVELPKRDQDSPPEKNGDETEISEDHHVASLSY